jgi:hypothetical protein
MTRESVVGMKEMNRKEGGRDRKNNGNKGVFILPLINFRLCSRLTPLALPN